MALHTHALKYYANGGSDAPDTRYIINSSLREFTVQLSSKVPTKSNYAFMGWSLNSSSTTAEYQPNSVYTFTHAHPLVDRTTELYAIWKGPVTLTVAKTGLGEVLINGSSQTSLSIKYGSQVTVEIKPNDSYYLHEVKLDESIISNKDTINPYKYTFTIRSNVQLNVAFILRQTHTLTVDTEYDVKGAGSYKYLEKPTLLANLSGLVNFSGWFMGENRVSSENPYTFDMPDENITLTLKVGSSIFDNKKYRQFALTNGNGEVYKLTDKNSDIFLDNPNNLGINKSIQTLRVGNSELVQNESYSMIQPSGNLIFHKNSNSGKYEDYFKFVRFASVKPITLWYKIPTNEAESEYHIPVEIMTLDKGQVNENGLLEIPISFYGTKFWQITQTQVESNQNSIEVYNDSDFPVGVHLTLRKSDLDTFSNPKIKFIQNNTEYGGVAIDYDDLKTIEFDSRDTSQEIVLYDGESIIPNPFSYIDFSYADGVKDFPFPKLKQGYSTIVFTFDEDTSTNKTYLVEFEREFLSV